MVSCVVYGCSNRNDNYKLKNAGITFHRFPKDPVKRAKWIRAVRGENWTPARTNVLCSLHFRPEDIDRTSLSCVRIRENAIPSNFPAFPPYLRKVPKSRKPPVVREVVDVGRSSSPAMSEAAAESEPASKDSPMVVSCSAVGCTQRGVKGCLLTFHSYPKDEERRKLWLRAVRRENFDPGPHMKLCSKHFAPECFYGRFGQKCLLRENAVPTIFDFQAQVKGNGRKVYRHSPERADDSYEGEQYSAPEYLLEEVTPDIKEEPLDVNNFSEFADVSRVETLRLPDDVVSRCVVAGDLNLQPVVWLPRLPLLNVSNASASIDSASLTTTQDSSGEPQRAQESPGLVHLHTRTDLTLADGLSSGANASANSSAVLSDAVRDDFTRLLGPVIVSTESRAKPVKKKVETKAKRKQPDSATVSKGPSDGLNMVFVKVVEGCDENLEPSLCVIETTSMEWEVDETSAGVTSWNMRLDQQQKDRGSPSEEPNRKDQGSSREEPSRGGDSRGEDRTAPSPAIDREDTEDRTAPSPAVDRQSSQSQPSEAAAAPDESAYDCCDELEETDIGQTPPSEGAETPEIVAATSPTATEERTTPEPQDIPPRLLLVGPLSHSEETLAALHSQLSIERFKVGKLRRELEKEHARRMSAVRQLKMIRQKFNRLQKKMFTAQLTKGVVRVDEGDDDVAWSET